MFFLAAFTVPKQNESLTLRSDWSSCQCQPRFFEAKEDSSCSEYRQDGKCFRRWLSCLVLVVICFVVCFAIFAKDFFVLLTLLFSMNFETKSSAVEVLAKIVYLIEF